MSITWVNKALTAPCAWGATSVPIGFMEGATQPFLDMIQSWPEVFHFTTRSGEDKQNARTWGEYHATPLLAEHGAPKSNTWTPYLQMDHLGLRIAGWHMNLAWHTPWRCVWLNTPCNKADTRWANGAIDFTSDRNRAWATVVSREGHVEHWRLDRARFVGGKGGMSIFSPRRKQPCEATEMRLAPTPLNNRQDFSLPMDPIPPCIQARRTAENWFSVFRGAGHHNRYHKVVRWLKQEQHVMRACLSESVRLQADTLDDDTLDGLLKRHRMPKDLAMGQSDIRSEWKGRMMRLTTGGYIEEVFANDVPLLEGTLNVIAIRRDNQTNTPWLDQQMFDQLERGWPTPGAHHKQHGMLLRAYPRSMYQSIFLWHAEVTKGSKTDAYTRLFTEPAQGHLPSWPFVVSVRVNIPKPGQLNAFRQIVNHSMTMEAEVLQRAGWSVAPELSSLNERLKAAAPEGTKLEMTKPADVGQYIAIFEAWGVKPVIVIADAESYFHLFKVWVERSFEQGTLTINGACLSAVKDMGGTDCPQKTGGFSSFVAEVVEAACDRELNVPGSKPLSIALAAMRAGRSAHFGAGNKQARLSFASMYSDDLKVVCAEEYEEMVKKVITKTGDDFNIRWTMDKYGNQTYLGREYRIREPGVLSTMHISPPKAFAYAEHCDRIRMARGAANKDMDSVLGQVDYSATTELLLKPRTKGMRRARHGQERMGSDWTHLGQPELADLDHISACLRRNEGIPVMCSTKWPDHNDIQTITQRGDACLREEDGYNGWGLWIIIPNKSGAPNIIAAFDAWSPAEEQAFGRNIPAAEAATALLGDRVLVHRKLWQKHHTGHLILSDSETTYSKFGSYKLGSDGMDALRDEWLKLQDYKPWAAALDHVAREFNVSTLRSLTLLRIARLLTGMTVRVH